MTDTAISVDQLGKQYRINQGGKKVKYKTLRDTIAGTLSTHLRWLDRKRKDQEEETFWALKDVSFDVKRGEVVGIIGRNGAGKSTLLKIISRITDPTEGTVDIYGRVGSLLEVGTGFHPELTGRENIYLNGAILGMKRLDIERKFDEIVTFSEVEKFIDTPVKHYSSGMYLRLAFAVAAHLEPEILLIDEVLAVGDAAFQAKCLGKMESVAQEGRTVLFVSHNLSAVSELCERGVYLENGKIKYIGDVKDTISTYVLSISNDARTDTYQSKADRFVFGKVELMGAKNGEIKYDEQLSFSVNFTALQELHDIRIDCVLHNSRRSTVFHLTTSNKSMGQEVIKPGRYWLHLGLPVLWLPGGPYTVVFKLRETGNPHFDKKIESDHLPFAVAGNISKFETMISPQPKWEIRSMDQ